jgi:endonuclease/exonuclease/phosphatase family metal-dependent hydrolase
MLRRIPLVVPLAAAVLLAAAPGALAVKKKPVTVKVMTRNVFLGTDLIPIAAADAAHFPAAAGAGLNDVKAGDPKGRMKLIGDEIAKAKPDLVGLQEVSLWRTGPAGDGKPATHVLYDFLGLIRKELKRRHASYRVVADRRGLDVEGTTDQGVDIRLTLGDVTLARKGVKVKHARTGVFANQLKIPTAGLGPVDTSRSWNSVDATVRGARLHFVNTHLEAYSADLRLKQAQELVAGPLRSSRETILVGDLNSGPTLAKPEDRPPYLAIAAAGFKPERTAKNSCCVDALDGSKGKWDHNVDWIMAKPKVKLVRSYTTGREKTKGGLMPSDHGGVVSILRLKR